MGHVVSGFHQRCNLYTTFSPRSLSPGAFAPLPCSPGVSTFQDSPGMKALQPMRCSKRSRAPAGARDSRRWRLGQLQQAARHVRASHRLLRTRLLVTPAATLQANLEVDTATLCSNLLGSTQAGGSAGGRRWRRERDVRGWLKLWLR